MKKIFFIMAVIGSLFSLNATEVNVSKVLDEYILAWNEHDIKKIDSHYGDNVIWYDVAYDYTTKGKKEVSRAITDAFLGNVADMYWVKSGDVFISQDTIIYEWVYGGTYNGKFDGKEIKNVHFELKGLSTTKINKQGKIVAHKDYYDLLGFKKQLGVIK